jgi:hypothetical protein
VRENRFTEAALTHDSATCIYALHEQTIGSLAGAGAGFNPEHVLYRICLCGALVEDTAEITQHGNSNFEPWCYAT